MNVEQMTTIEAIKASPVYQEILKDSFGGVMYDISNRSKYDTTAIEALWYGLTDGERESQDGIIKGLFNFLKAYEV